MVPAIDRRHDIPAVFDVRHPRQEARPFLSNSSPQTGVQRARRFDAKWFGPKQLKETECEAQIGKEPSGSLRCRARLHGSSFGYGLHADKQEMICLVGTAVGRGITFFDTAELTALGRPFIYFPLEGHSEQAGVARILRRRGAGVEMKRSTASPAKLAERIVSMLGTNVTCPQIPTDGARRAAQHIVELMQRPSPE